VAAVALAAVTIAAIGLAAVTIAVPAAAEPARQLLQAERSSAQAEAQAKDALARARASAAEEERLAAQRVASAAALRETETAVAADATEVSALAEKRAATEARLHQRAAEMAPLLPLIERLALYPTETLLAMPGPPEDALRGLTILRGIAQRLETEAAQLRQEQVALAAQSAALDAALAKLRAVQATQADQAQALDQQLAAAHALRDRMDQAGSEAQRRAALEASRADNLRSALATLEQQRARAEAQARDDAARATQDRQEAAAVEARRREAAFARPAGPGPEPHGQLLAPVAGTVVRAWGDPTDAGPATGVSYRPPPAARVVAPCGGRIRFAGPFRSFGALIILDCGGGYAFVLAGLERLDVAVGAAVLPGEPVGTMPGWDAASTGPRPALYMELRHDGQAVNPAPFLRGKG
jgi:septal ring factor EnvC (AmiA/AmiB activator)